VETGRIPLQGKEISQRGDFRVKTEEDLEIRVRGIGAGGVGIGDLPDGKVVFLPRGAPGDLARIRVVQVKDRWARGEILELLEAGPGRRKPPCPRYGECDGCSLQHLEYPEQLDWKGRIAADALERIGGLSDAAPTVVPSPAEFNYRNKATMTLRRLAGGGLVAGFREVSRKHRVMDLGAECLLMVPELSRLWGDLRAAWGPGASLLPRGRELRLTLRFGETEGALLIHGGTGDGEPDLLLEAIPGLGSIWRGDRADGVRHLAGTAYLGLSWMEESLQVPGNAFVQVNQGAGENLHRYVLDTLEPLAGTRVVEGYCGTGALGRALARRGATVVGIEADRQAVAEANRQAPKGFQAVEGRVEDLILDHLPADLALLNPPRTGLDRRVPEILTENHVGRMVYVSCDPATLARDLKRLRSTYEFRDVRSFDLFPQTAHVETVVTLVHRGA
jgi:23S rRNA (uracil1939-C5)-methyltransferase